MENDDLSRYLDALERDDCYRVDATLKESPHELTQRVFFVGMNGAKRGPYIRKLIDRESGMGAAYTRIFEAQEAGRRFKHIPRIHECYHDERSLVVVMELVPGETLQDVVYRRNPSLQLASDVFPLVCDAVTELHESFDPPLIHRDLKPSNIMLAGDELTVIDFGIAREFRQGAETDTVKFGTRAFAPPEQFGFGQTTVQSDVYALGMLLYFCLTEKIPTQQVRDAKFAVEGVPPRMQAVIARATEIDASKRYASAAELKAAFLEAAGEIEPESSETGQQPVGDPSSPSGAKRRAGMVAIAACAAVAIAAVCFLAFIGIPGSPHDAGSGIGDVSGSSSSGSAFSSNDATGQSPAEDGNASSADGGDNGQSPNGSEEATPATADASPESQIDAGTATENALARDTGTSAPPREGFDPQTNRRVNVAGVVFQIPAYFGEPIAGEGDAVYYYAESGSSCAMIMTAASALNPNEQGEPYDPKTVKDSYLAGLVGSDAAFTEATSLTECTLAGHSARIVTFNGTVQNLPLATKVVYFYDPEANAIGSIIFGQTSNVQFDCSSDFAKTVASATRDEDAL